MSSEITFNPELIHYQRRLIAMSYAKIYFIDQNISKGFMLVKTERLGQIRRIKFIWSSTLPTSRLTKIANSNNNVT